MSHTCEKCTKTFEGDFILCEGFCSTKVCMRCSGLSPNLVEGKAKNLHLIWICTCCKNLLSNARFKNALTSVSSANNDFIDSFKTSLKNEIQESILQLIRSEMRSGFKDLPTPKATPCPNQLIVPIPGTKRRRFEETRNSTPRRPPPPRMCAQGTNSDFTDISQNSESTPTFSLYLAGVHPSVSDKRVLKMIHSHLGDSNVKIRKLVPRGRDINTLSFVSFKVDMHADLKGKALTTETWPVGIRFREFTGNGSSAVFWAPKQQPLPLNTIVQTTPFITPNQ